MRGCVAAGDHLPMSGYHVMRREAVAEPYTAYKRVKMVEIARKQQIQLVNPAGRTQYARLFCCSRPKICFCVQSVSMLLIHACTAHKPHRHGASGVTQAPKSRRDQDEIGMWRRSWPHPAAKQPLCVRFSGRQHCHQRLAFARGRAAAGQKWQHSITAGTASRRTGRKRAQHVAWQRTEA